MAWSQHREALVTLLTIVQARMRSTRLPGKTLMRSGGSTILEHVIGRVRMCPADTGQLIVATSVHAADDPIETLCHHIGVDCYRSSEHDVLNRYHQAALHYQADNILRITADEPLLCPQLTADILTWPDGMADYVTVENVPLGLTGELITAAALYRCWQHATDPGEREHVTLHALNNPSFDLALIQPGDLLFDRRHWRLTLDTPDDLELLERLYTLTGGHLFSLDTEAVIAAVESDEETLSLATKHNLKGAP
jgi:spore coat polysaccharide biosynthesis protein SpsF (cytidylyltransferase family)